MKALGLASVLAPMVTGPGYVIGGHEYHGAAYTEVAALLEAELRPQGDHVQVLSDLHAKRWSIRRRPERLRIARPCGIQPVDVDQHVIEHHLDVGVREPVGADGPDL